MLHFPKGFRVPKAYRHPHFLLLPTTPSQAVAHHARSTIKVRVASQSDLVNLLPFIPVEEAGVEASGDVA